MARLLIKAEDNINPDPEKDKKGSFKGGMCVAIREDGAEWGTDEVFPMFYQIDIDGEPPELFQYLLDYQNEDDGGAVENNFDIIRIRRFYLDKLKFKTKDKEDIDAAKLVKKTIKELESVATRIRDGKTKDKI